ncbi:MAG: methionyl-tRNA formyltransferase [Treponema sp.]|nr:methionyl-tRNA formyltransferase [Treponema sp.]
MRILFAGTPAIALPSLQVLAGPCLGDGAPCSGRPAWEAAGLLTNPDRVRRRGGKAESSEAAACAERLSAALAEKGLPPIPVLKPETLKSEAREAAAALRPDLLVCFAYGRIFGPRFLSIFPLGGINIHPSLLPKYRGASPIQEAILNRDTLTGITLQRIAREMDSGNILAQKELPLSGRETTASLSALAAEEGAALLGEFLRRLTASADSGAVLEGRPQEGEASYCSLIDRDSARIDWSQSAVEIDARIRAYNPWPLARTGCGDRTLYILEAAPLDAGPRRGGESGRVLGIDKKYGILVATGGGILALTKLQYQAKKALPWQAFLNGARDFIGSCLSGGF